MNQNVVSRLLIVFTKAAPIAMDHPLFINMSTVKIFPQIASQAKKRLLRGAHKPQISLAGNKKLLSALNDL